MNIALIYHRDPYTRTPRGGEKSVRAIIEYLIGKGHNVALANGPAPGIIEAADVVLTWGKPALATAQVCKEKGTPLVLMVRFWRNVVSLPAGNLMTRDIDEAFREQMRPLYETAAAIVTNTKYARSAIHRHHPASKGKVRVSYVPVLGEAVDMEPGECWTVVTPEIYGEKWLVQNLSVALPDEKFLVVNAQMFAGWMDIAQKENVQVCGYMEMSDVWQRTKGLLVPVYDNDICGTRRVTIEAFRYGRPVIAMDRCGMNEKVPDAMLARRNAKIPEWVDRIQTISKHYQWYQKLARAAWRKYDTGAELEGFEEILKQCAKQS